MVTMALGCAENPNSHVPASILQQKEPWVSFSVDTRFNAHQRKVIVDVTDRLWGETNGRIAIRAMFDYDASDLDNIMFHQDDPVLIMIESDHKLVKAMDTKYKMKCFGWTSRGTGAKRSFVVVDRVSTDVEFERTVTHELVNNVMDMKDPNCRYSFRDAL